MKTAAKEYLMDLLLDLESYVYNRAEEGGEEEQDLIDRIAFLKEYLDKENVKYVLKDGEVYCYCNKAPSSCCGNGCEC